LRHEKRFAKLAVSRQAEEPAMILEIATLNVKPGQEARFEATLREARHLIAATPGFQKIELRRCIETRNRYQLFATWTKLEDHTVGFRQGPNYAKWREMLHHFYEQIAVEHYEEPLTLG
jgi:heme-degrading monooxygenase HmoA